MSTEPTTRGAPAGRPEDVGDDAAQDVQSLLAEREDLRELLVQKDKLATLGGMAAGIAHEIKNPLHFVQNFAEVVADLADELSGIVEDARGRMPADTIEDLETLQGELGEAASKIVEHTQRVDGVVKSMLLGQWGSSAERHLVDVNALVRESATVAYHGLRSRKVIGPGVALEFDLDEGLAPIVMAPHGIHRAVSNIVTNACEAANATADDRLPTVRVATRGSADEVCILVADAGPGISDEDRPHIFEPFFTTKSALVNTGLGLSQVWDVVTRDHAGRIDIETSKTGTTVTLVMPRTAET